MKIISCPGGKYLLGNGLLSSVGSIIANTLQPRKVLLVSDENVFTHYGQMVTESFENTDITIENLVFAPGEDSKSLTNLEIILNKLSDGNYSRSDVLAVLGGGVMGDLGGFAASCFKRGMKLVQIPTSLLAMVDSSVGGKTAVNLCNAKNQVGTFYQPSITLADSECLATLPQREYRCGCAEVIKYAVLFDGEFYDALLKTEISDQYEYVIEKCVGFKSDIVSRDEQDKGCRQLLNLGHTIGHAVEALSGYTIAHGEAVGIGMAAITEAAEAKGFCGRDCTEAVHAILNRYNLPCGCRFAAEDLYKAICKDKKISGGELSLIVPVQIGKCEIVKVAGSEIPSWLNTGDCK